MDYAGLIGRVYEHIENGHVDKAVMGRLRIARHLKDYLYVAVLTCEINPHKDELVRGVCSRNGKNHTLTDVLRCKSAIAV